MSRMGLIVDIGVVLTMAFVALETYSRDMELLMAGALSVAFYFVVEFISDLVEEVEEP